MCVPCPSGVLYCATKSYSAKKEDEVSVPIGSAVQVLRKSDDGWWLIRYLSAKPTFSVAFTSCFSKHQF